MLVSRQDCLLDMIQRASQALAALFVQIDPGDRPEQDDQNLDRDLDDLFSGLDLHAHQLDPDTLRAVLRRDDRVLLFAILQARKGVQRLHAGDEAGGRPRLRCAHALLLRLVADADADPDPSPRALALADVARPLAATLTEFAP
jgi:hypothetical protein